MLRLLAPRFWGAHVLVIAAVVAAILLGRWQLSVWDAERVAAERDLSDAPAVALDDVFGPDDPFPGEELGKPATLSGEWSEPTVYVEERQSGDREGFWVVTPVLVDGTESVIPVVRGWSATPTSQPVEGRVDLEGWLQAGEGSGRVDRDPTDDRIPELRIASLTGLVDADLYGGYVVSRAPTPGLEAVTPDQVPRLNSVTGLQNLLYGFQWWLFGGFAVFLWWRWCRDRLRMEDLDAAERDETPVTEPGSGPEETRGDRVPSTP